jgi:hypothetical protein
LSQVPEKIFVSGNDPDRWSGPAQVLEGGLGCRMTGIEFQSRTLILTCDPAAVCFLFDMAFP